MEIKTFAELIGWTRQMHAHHARCLKESAALNGNDRISALLDYLSTHEDLLAREVAEYEKQADPKAMQTRLYDHGVHKPVEENRTCDMRYNDKSFDEITREIFKFHDEIIALYDSLAGKAEIPEAQELAENLKELEEHESMRMAGSIGRMSDI